MSIKQRQVVVVHRWLDNEKDFDFNLGLDFVPTSFIVRAINYKQSANTGINVICSSFVNSKDNILGVFVADDTSDYSSNPSTTFKIINPASLMNGDVKFRIKRLADNVVDPGNANGVLAITLEFIEEDIAQPKPKISDIDKLINFLKTEKASQDIYPFAPIPTNKYKGGEDEKEEKDDTPETPEDVDLSNVAPTQEDITDDTRNAYDQTTPPFPNVNLGKDTPLLEQDEDVVIV